MSLPHNFWQGVATVYLVGLGLSLFVGAFIMLPKRDDDPTGFWVRMACLWFNSLTWPIFLPWYFLVEPRREQ